MLDVLKHIETFTDDLASPGEDASDQRSRTDEAFTTFRKL
jgi:hypothetical protein